MSTATVASAIKDANRNTPFSKQFKSQWWRHLLGIIAVVFAAFPPGLCPLGLPPTGWHPDWFEQAVLPDRLLELLQTRE